MRKASRAYWICQVIGWGFYSVLGAFLAGQTIRGYPMKLWVSYGLFGAYSILFTHLLRREILRRDWLLLPFGRSLWRCLGAALVCGAIQSLMVIAVDALWPTDSRNLRSSSMMLSLFMGVEFAALAWTALYVAITSMRRFQEARVDSLRLELALKQAELRALEAQVNPHFLFNALNTIRGLIETEPGRARDLVTQLSTLLRAGLERDGLNQTSLGDELGIVRNYLAIESVRFEDRLKVEWSIEPESLRLAVPAMLLQTLIENAIKHGVARIPGGGTVKVIARREGMTLQLEVLNDGTLGETGSGTRVGLKNAKERLRLLYGEQGTLELTQLPGDKVRARVALPAGDANASSDC